MTADAPILAGASGPGADVRWLDDEHAEVGGVRFVAGARSAAPGQFLIVKPPDLVRRYLSVIEAERPRRIVELGVKEGGSAALMALAADPEVLVAVDLAAEVPPLLAELAARADLAGRLVTAFGIDQSDRAALAGAVDEAVGGRPLDLVIDDASHLLAPTRASFEVLFPRLRPGGLFVIEDWCSEAFVADRVARHAPPGQPGSADRLAAVRSLVHTLNTPGTTLPPEAVEAITVAAAELPTDAPVPGGESGPLRLLGHLVDAAATADLAVLRRATGVPPRPLVDIAVELMMIRATGDTISDLHIDGEWIAVRRGPGELDPQRFRLADVWADHFGYLG